MEYSQNFPPPQKKATARTMTKNEQCGKLAKDCEENMCVEWVCVCVCVCVRARVHGVGRQNSLKTASGSKLLLIMKTCNVWPADCTKKSWGIN